MVIKELLLKKVLKLFIIIVCLFIAWMFINALRIHYYTNTFFNSHSDVAIVLGAGTNQGNISPVFRERLNHGIRLVKEKKVRTLILTGGYGEGQKISDSQAAMLYVVQKGISKEKIFIEEMSTITYTNLMYSKEIMQTNNFRSALIVSNPYHMKRSMAMCRKLSIHGLPSPTPTPTSMYRSRKSKLKSLIYESFFYNLGVIQGYIRL